MLLSESSFRIILKYSKLFVEKFREDEEHQYSCCCDFGSWSLRSCLSSSASVLFLLLLLDVGGGEDADGAPFLQLAEPPPVRLLVVHADDVPGADRQLVVHVGVVVVDDPGGGGQFNRHFNEFMV